VSGEHLARVDPEFRQGFVLPQPLTQPDNYSGRKRINSMLLMQLNTPIFKFVTLLTATTVLTTIGALMFNHASLAQTNRQVTLSLTSIDAIDPSPLQVDSIFSNVWRNGNTFSGHVDILSQIPLADRTGANPLGLAIPYAICHMANKQEIKLQH
jgi:hypothetical protein